MAVLDSYSFLDSSLGKLWLLMVFLSPPKLLMKWSGHRGITSRCLRFSQWISVLLTCQWYEFPGLSSAEGTCRLHGWAKLWCLWLSSVEGWCFQSSSSSCCSFFGCFLQKISCSDPSVFSDRMQRTLRCLTVWLNQAEGTLCFPGIST